MRPYPTIILTALCTACGLATPPAPQAFEPCEVSGAEAADSMGRQVHGAGFTFCIPESWRPTMRAQDSTDAKEWRGSGGSVLWGLGRPGGFIGGDVEVTATMPVVTGGNPRPIPQEPPSVCSRKTTPLTPDGVSLMMIDIECQRQWTITALSTHPAIFVQGETRSAHVAKLLEAIMRTVRFPQDRR